MAYLAANDKLKGEQDQATDQPQAATTGGPQSVSGASTDVVGTGNAVGSTTPGQGAWTNIQAYMNANKDDTGTAQALESKVGSQFDSEKTAFTNDSAAVKQKAQEQSAPVANAQKNAADWINQSGAAYNYAGAQSDQYNQNKSNLQNALSATYSGPTSYTYGMSADTQATANSLSDAESFNQYLGNLYQDKAGGQLSSGGRALQAQLDVNNQAVQDSRQTLLDRYKTLVGDRDKTVTDTTNALSQAQTDFSKNQNALRDQLTNTASGLDTKIGQAESDARAAYDTAYNSGSGRAVSGYDGIRNTVAEGGSNFISGANQQMSRQNAGIWGDNLTYAQLQKEQQAIRPLMNETNLYWGQMNANNDALNKFYTDQDTKYANTADAEERQWNFIQDVLGNADRKEEGFKVRNK